jgi:hypothetical protein
MLGEDEALFFVSRLIAQSPERVQYKVRRTYGAAHGITHC